MAAQVSQKKQQDLQTQYGVYKNTLQQIAQKIGDVEQEAEEHKLVLETLQPLSEDRKCFRLINGVLMEQTVKDVMPALTTNSEGLKKVLEDLVKQYKAKQDELEKWKEQLDLGHEKAQSGGVGFESLCAYTDDGLSVCLQRKGPWIG
ncbi:Prefoldin subunit-domain-containing protein [Colletotrichum godetiae]|uniref:Prefoldin subunit-domain-containing protein n=1 Tax=Colletotrichum godetiae TaxID=1209918 RepID=A0AAJ0EUH4_9PEZI|nr:Prefoldin subunit-domain-containing protein [Colletotrichum godetiae]KAK1687624.1 Prefoldin subunit-domain-containing protein [Colletotrichum godetiae]